MPLYRYDVVDHLYRIIPDDATCHCCGRPHGDQQFSSKLCIDHIDRKPGGRRQILCVGCNSKKGKRPYVSVNETRCWYPGMAPRSTVAKPVKFEVVVVYRELPLGRP